MFIQGIPYFGENTQEIIEKIQCLDWQNIEIQNAQVLEWITSQKNSLDNLVICIKTFDSTYMQWLKDIKFDYKHKRVYIPYFSYKTAIVQDKKYISNNKGHLILKGNSCLVRYEYQYSEHEIKLEDTLLVYNIEKQEPCILKISKWTQRTEFNIESLYDLYKEYAESENSLEHDKGYHYITKQTKGFKNVEKLIRKRVGLKDLSTEHIRHNEYRDVWVKANKQNQQNQQSHKTARVMFEQHLFCYISGNVLPDKSDLEFRAKFIKFINNLNQSNKRIESTILKYGKDKPLIFKKHWFTGRIERVYTWDRD